MLYVYNHMYTMMVKDEAIGMTQFKGFSALV